MMTTAPGTPAAVVFFRRDTTVLDAHAKLQVRAAAAVFLSRGGQGFVRVVGHASSGGNDMSASRNQTLDFEHSQARADAVARALIAAGVPADRVLESAVGAQQSVQSEAPPEGVDPNHSAEIYFQS